MNRTKCIAHVVPALLVSCFAVAAWGQSQSGFPVGQQSGGRIPPNMWIRPERPDRPLLPRKSASAAVQGQADAAIPPFAKYKFVNIDVPSAELVQPNGVNDDGVVAGWYQDAQGNRHGFVWKNGKIQTLDYPGATATYLNAINNGGVAIGNYTDASGSWHSLTYSIGLSSWSMLPDIPDYSLYLLSNGINDDGVAVGFGEGFFGTLAWIWHPDLQSYSFFTAPGAREASTYAYGLNDHGEVVGTLQTWAGGGFSIGFLREDCSESCSENSPSDCIYKTFNILPSPSGFNTYPLGVNNDGTVVGWYFAVNTTYGFVMTRDGVLKSVNYPGFAGSVVNGISNRGVICGDAFTASGAAQGFVAYPE